jgi:hypothetical protein
MTARYAEGKIDSDFFQEWFLKASLAGFPDAGATMLADRIEGLMAEAAHALWPEPELREELATIVRSSASADRIPSFARPTLDVTNPWRRTGSANLSHQVLVRVS